MRLPSFLRLPTNAYGLLIVPFLALAFAFPAGAETGTKPPSAPAGNTPPSAQAKPTPPATQPKSGPAVAQPKSDAAVAQPESDAAAAPEANASSVPNGSPILINIDKSRQEMTVFVDGVEQYTWPVSTGRPEYSTPSGTYTPTSMNEMWYSKQWDNSPMPHSIFFMKDGHAIHGTHEVKNLGKAVSHGCVRISPQNAATLYALVETNGMQNTQVVLSGYTPGGEGPKVASPSPGQYPQYGRQRGQAFAPWFAPGEEAQAQPAQPRRRGLFGRWFQPNNGPQGYYGQRNYYYQPRGYPPPGY
jgi:lipoprotein-anchoring transpeptidase ErfK/SrfK